VSAVPTPLAAELETLSHRINEAHEAAAAAVSKGIGHAIECGRLLIEAKAKVPHGEWLPWLEANCTVGARMARHYMRLARHSDQLNRKRVSDFSVREAIAEITKRVTVASGLKPETLSAVMEQDDDSKVWWELKRALRRCDVPEPTAKILRRNTGKEDRLRHDALNTDFQPQNQEKVDAIRDLVEELRGVCHRFAGRHPEWTHFLRPVLTFVHSEAVDGVFERKRQGSNCHSVAAE